MRRLFLFLFSFAIAFGTIRADSPPPPVHILLETEQGAIELELDAQHAPISAVNFLKYLDEGLYDGGVFHRTVKPDNQPNNKIKIEVIQDQSRFVRQSMSEANRPLVKSIGRPQQAQIKKGETRRHGCCGHVPASRRVPLNRWSATLLFHLCAESK